MKRWLWMLAAIISAVVAASLWVNQSIDLCFFCLSLGGFLFIVPYAAAVALTALVGRWHTGAAVIALTGSCIMAALSWWQATHTNPDSDVQDPQLVNAYLFIYCCGANFLVLFVVTIAALSTAMIYLPDDEAA